MFGNEFEWDLAARRFYQMEQILWQFDDDDAPEPEYFRKARNLRNGMWRRKKRMDDVKIMMGSHPEDSPQWAAMKKEYDTVRADFLLRGAQIYYYWTKFFPYDGDDLEGVVRQAVGMKPKAQDT